MKFLSCYYKRLKIRSIKVAVLAVIISIFFLPSYIPFKNTGHNMFTIFINNVSVGVVGTREEAKNYLRQARKEIAAVSEDLIFIENDMVLESSEVLWGEVDDEKDIVQNMINVLQRNVRETLQHSYTLKINEYSVNLSSKEEVLALLRAAIYKYDEEEQYTVELALNPDRELPVLTAKVISNEEVEEKEARDMEVMSAGIDAVITDVFAEVEPAVEKTFADYDLGLIYLDFGDTVEIVEAYLLEEELTPVKEAIDEVTKDQEKNEIYEVVSGDTLSQIAIKTNLPMDKLIEMNENLVDENSVIRVEDELIITVPEPELTVVRQEECYYEEDYEEDVVYVDNDEWYTTQTKTLQEPSAGHRKVVATVTYRNDKEEAREILKEEITYEAVPKIVERGTKIPPTYIKPLSGGRLSSQFGKRNAPTRGASTYHKGVDWATPVGTAVMASSAGTVAKAGWGSGYGYVVYINHADGRQTRYGHLSKVLVSAGQTVSQGQKIALSGNTGVSSGPHVHFEILIGGTQVNPLKYLN